ncbi:hypothetical protein MMC10_001579 [Thelotrema lepadinum]|nr:hypothetical protein [Thelotrema lepadinum]
MPTKVMLLFGRIDSITPAAFKDHFENVHIPLIKSLVGEDFPVKHTRMYLERTEDGPNDASVWIGGQDDFKFDVAAQMTFADEEHWKRFMAKATDPEVQKILHEDDEKFSDRSKTRAVTLRDVCIATNKD